MTGAVTGAGTTVRAAVVAGVGAPFEVRPVELVPVGPGQVRVRIAASGVCRSDLSVRDGSLPFVFPTVLGHEGAGIVEEVGDGVTRVVPGDHVVLTWVPACRRCFWCLAGQPVLCANGLAEALGSPYATLDGAPIIRGLGTATFAEATVVPEGSVVPVRRDVPLDQAALVGCALATGVGAVWNTAHLRPGSTVAVVGCGGVGLAAVQGARLAGAVSVVAVDRVRSRLDAAVALGATDTVDAGAGDPVAAVRSLTAERGVDVAFEVVGASATIRQAFEMTRRGGSTVIVGAGSAEDPVQFNAMELFVDGKALLGCVYGSTDPDRDFPLLVDLVCQGRLDAASMVTERIGLDDLEAAFRAMQAGEGTRSVVVFDG
jgi:S-(hydroxymethyl)glutathione dehydrogenase / alcohol dehydrogenase